MKKIIAFGASNSSDSINKQLAAYAAGKVENAEVQVLDLNDYDLPIYSKQLEASDGHPENAARFLKKLEKADGIVISLAEYNGAYTSVFKNLFDWMSRIERNLFYDKPMLLMATSTGARGGQSVLAMAMDRFPRHGANIAAKFSLPSFHDNFSEGKLTNLDLKDELMEQVKEFENSL